MHFVSRTPRFKKFGESTDFPSQYVQFESRGVVRGLHYQSEPNTEAKLVRCLRGSVWDVVVDLRQQLTYLWQLAFL